MSINGARLATGQVRPTLSAMSSIRPIERRAHDRSPAARASTDVADSTCITSMGWRAASARRSSTSRSSSGIGPRSSSGRELSMIAA